MELKILNQAVKETLRILAERDLCANPADLELYVEEGWDCAVSERGQDPEDWIMERDHATCVSAAPEDLLFCGSLTVLKIKQRINSWRGHAHKRVESGIAGAYNLGSANSPTFVMDRVAEISEKTFHRKVSIPNLEGQQTTHVCLVRRQKEGEL